MSEKEARIRSITRLYYSNPEIQKAMLKFSEGREVIPRYYEGFGKRPDFLQYPSDIMGWANKGATSLHVSEEIWEDPMKIDSDMSRKEMDEIRKKWDLLIDVDSKFFDCSKIATKLIIAALEHHGIKNYGIKFSGSKGFHIIVPGKAFPDEFMEEKTRYMFPEWPRAISEYLMNFIRADYNIEMGKEFSESVVEKRTNMTKEELRTMYCGKCNRAAKRGIITKFECGVCKAEVERRNIKPSKRKLLCVNSSCPGFLESIHTKEYFYCNNCKDPDNNKLPLNSIKHEEYFEEQRGIDAEKIAALDLVLVAPRHLFRMPYSLHEKTALSSIVLNKDEIDNFSLRDASPLNVKIRDFYPESVLNEGERLLASAVEWKKNMDVENEKFEKKRYSNQEYEKIDAKNINESMFPKPIKKLLKGLEEGRKRGLFVLITFLRSLNFSPDYINNKVREWNKLNDPPLKEGYVKSQIDWHLKQRKKILPPNYSNNSFYKDLKLLDEEPKVKNPLVDVVRQLRREY